MIRDALGDRMKHNYEDVSKTRLTRRMPVIIRLDGCHFHTFTKGFKKPFDEIMIKTMQDTMKYLCENIQGCVLGYTQSDEITLILQDYKELDTDAWFDYEVQKMCSVSASMATLAFNKFYAENITEMIEDEEEFKKYALKINKATFDSRCFNIPKEEVTNCLLWRQYDAERNSINSLAQSLYSHKELQGLNVKEVKAKMDAEKSVVWGNLPTTQKRGSCCIRENQLLLHRLTKTLSSRILNIEVGDMSKDKIDEMLKQIKERIESRSFVLESADLEKCMNLMPGEDFKYDLGPWVIDNEIPRFNEDRNYIENLINFEEVKCNDKR